MKEFVIEFLDYMVSTRKNLKFGIEDIKFVLIHRFDKKTLMYKHHYRYWIKEFFDLIRMSGLGKYDKNEMTLILSPDNPDIRKIMFKYDLKIEREKENSNQKVKDDDTKKYDELVK
jgi:hypothetical protein